MSVRVVPVDESQKDQPGVEKAVTTIGGQTIESYARLERVDDVDGKTTDNVVEIEMLIPVEDEDSDDPDNLYIFNRALIDLGEANMIKYMKAIAPFADKARLAPPQEQGTATPSAPAKRSRAYHPKLTEWNRRVKKWLREEAGHDEVKDRGRVPAHLEEIYVKNHPDDPKPK